MSDPYAQPPRPADEPPSQPFQPMSYDLAPEFSTPSNPAPPPAYPPASGAPYAAPPQPYQQGYQAPGYAAPQPGSGVPGGPVVPPPGSVGPPPVGFPAAPAAPRRKGRGLTIALSIVGAVVVLCGVLSCVFAYPIISESGATVSAPNELPGGLTKDTSTSMQQNLDELTRQFKSDFSADQAVAGFYNDSEGHQVLLVAATGLILFPDTEVDDAFKDADSDFNVTNVASHDAGKLGGTVKCGSGTISDVNMTACIWADHGSAGAGFFLEREVSESIELFLQIREAVEKR